MPQARVRELVEAGLLTRHPDGSLSYDGPALAAKEQQQAQQRAAEQKAAEDANRGEALPDQQAEGLVHAIAQTTTPESQMAVINSLVESGEVSPVALNRIATEMGLEPAQAGELISKISSAMSQQANAAVASVA